MSASDPVGEVGAFLDAYSAAAREEIRRDHIPASCVSATWITIEAPRHCGLRAEPMETKVSIGNSAYRRLRDEVGPPASHPELEEWARTIGAQVRGIGFDPPTESTIGGHIVALRRRAEGVRRLSAAIRRKSAMRPGCPAGVGGDSA